MKNPLRSSFRLRLTALALLALLTLLASVSAMLAVRAGMSPAAVEMLRVAQGAVGLGLMAIVAMTWRAAGRLRRGYEDVERRVAEQTAQIREQGRTLIELARAGASDSADIQDALRRTTEAASRTVGVARASVWVMDEPRARIWCVDLFDTATGRHTCGVGLARPNFPAYFRALDEEQTIAAADAPADPRTREFTEAYLRPLGIGAMLDAPVRVRGRTVGVVCLEHVGGARAWTAGEEHFAACVANLVATVVESSERHRAEAALRESEERYRLVSRATNDVVWDWVCTTNAIYWNDALRRVFGHEPAVASAGELEWWLGQLHPDDADRVAMGLRAAMEGRAEAWSAEYRFRRADGTYAAVLDRGVISRDPSGRAVRMIGSMMDVTERKRAEEVERERAGLARAVGKMEQVLGVVGHELRTPLAGLRAMSEFLLTDGAAGTAEFEQFLRDIHEEVVRMSGTVHDLLEAARLNSGKARWNWSTFGLAAVCDEAVGSVRPVVDAQRVALTLAVEPPGLTMRGDADAVRRLVVNLLSNAHKHTAAGSIAVSVRAEAGGTAVRVEVRDTGSGIAPEIRDRLGEAFALNSGVVGGTYVSGTGLGLAICKAIVTAHGGAMEVESAPGRGTGVVATMRTDLAGPVAELIDNEAGGAPPVMEGVGA